MKALVDADLDFDAVVVGGGVGGIYALYRLRKLGLSIRLYEAGSGIGGTWYWNRYPGARCDVESLDYSYSFSEELQQEWHWTERFASQPEILNYINHVADRFDLRRDIELQTRIIAAVFDEASSRWVVSTEHGEQVRARFCIMATGCLSSAQIPNILGQETFSGPTYHTGQWPHEPVDFGGQRVAVIGTGSSAVQSIPLIAQDAEHLFVFQRTANYAVPAQNAPLDPAYELKVKSNYAEFRRQALESRVGFVMEPNDKSALAVSPEERETEYEKRWQRGGLGFAAAFVDLLTDQAANDTAAEFCRNKIRLAVRDPAVADRLIPRGNPLGAMRLCVSNDYYEAFNRDNVTLIDLTLSPIESLTPRGVQTRSAHYDVDSIVYATGYDAMTGALLRIDVRGRGDLSLRDKWEAGPRTYLGLATTSFPNLFLITGPGSPSVLANMILGVEHHVDWIADCIAHVRRNGKTMIEAAKGAEDAWVKHVNDLADMTLFPLANSWYVGANIPGKPRIFMPYVAGLRTYRQKCAEIVANGYEGFDLTSSPDHISEMQSAQSGAPNEVDLPCG
jgi:cyclohexanone monooxygenase